MAFKRWLKLSVTVKVTAAVLFLSMTAGLGQRDAHATLDVWIDPGHGNYDSGTVGIDGAGYPNEADLTFALCDTWLQGWLVGFGYNVALTRNSEGNHSSGSWLKPRDRTLILNGRRQNDLGFQDSAAIIISVHMDAACNDEMVNGQKVTKCDSTIHKTTTYFNFKSGPRYTYNFAQSLALALTVHPYVIAQANVAFMNPTCRGDGQVNEGNFFMIRDVRFPAILVEACKLTNRCQLNHISNDNEQSEIAYGIASGVTHYMSPGGIVTAPAALSSEGLRAAMAAVGEVNFRGGMFRAPRPIETRSAAVQASFQESFEGTTFPPTGWTRQTSGAPAPHMWGRTTDTLIVRSRPGAAIVSGQYASAMDEWLVSPMLKVGASDHGLSFYWAGNRDLAGAANATCLIKRKSEGTWTQMWSLAAEPLATPFVYRERCLSLTTYVGDSIQFAFRVQGTNGPDFAVDDVAVGDFVATATPTNENCASAMDLPAGTFSIAGVTTYGSDDVDPGLDGLNTCVGDLMDGPDVVYRVNGLVGDTLSVRLDADWSPALYLVTACGNPTPTCRIGSYPVDASTDATAFNYFFDTTGPVYLVVDSPVGESGPFTLSGTWRGTVTGVGPTGAPSTGLRFVASPNPSRGSVIIQGVAPVEARTTVRVTIHDVSGRTLRVLDTDAAGGRFSLGWDGRLASGSRAPAGVYFVRVEAGGIRAQRNLVLAR